MTEARMIPSRYTPVLFGFLLSGMMSGLISGLSTFLAVGLPADFPLRWFTSWLTSWAIAFPTVLVVAPVARRLVATLTRDA
ncbi:DUF2798 domain-containing protein [Lutimaribacter pacificus]